MAKLKDSDFDWDKDGFDKTDMDSINITYMGKQFKKINQ